MNACRHVAIDIHAHVVPASFPTWIGKHAPAQWPSMVDAATRHGRCHRCVMIAGKAYRTVSDQCWNVDERLKDMAAMGVASQVLSPMPELLSYWWDASSAQVLLRFLNETIAQMIATSRGAMFGLAAVPLQDVDLAIQELEYAVTQLQLSGVEIGSHVNGVPLGDLRLRPFFKACEALDVPVFVHALKPVGMERLVGAPALQQVLAYPTDVGLAAASVITGNLLQDCPALRIAFSHGGGTFASLLPRLQQGWLTFPALRDDCPQAPVEQARKLYFDTLVYDESTLKLLVEKLGSTQLMVGTDYPFNFHERQPLQRIDNCEFSADVVRALRCDNAARFLGLNRSR